MVLHALADAARDMDAAGVRCSSDLVMPLMLVMPGARSPAMTGEFSRPWVERAIPASQPAR
jgi:hypothetical protein